MTSRLRKLVLWSCSGVALLAVGLFVMPAIRGDPRLHSKARKQWKEQAIADMTERSSDRQMITNEIAILHAEAADKSGDGWIGTNVLLMTNGEYLVYSHVDTKQAGGIADLFLARGSDGKWYYSTFHFCINMITLRGEILGESKNGSIAEFASAYAAREFDGKSNECLRKTWPFKGWQGKLNSGNN